MAMVAYTGIESMAQLGGEARNPQKTVPRAIMLAMGTLLLMYLGLSLVALSSMTPGQLSGQYLEDPLAGIVASLPTGSSLLLPWVGILAAILLFVAANAGLVGASRLAFNMGEHLQLPRFFYRLTGKSKTPYIAIAIFGGLAALIVVASGGDLLFMANLYNFGAMLAFFCAHLSLIMHRIRFPDMERPFKVSFNLKIFKRAIPLTAVLGALATLAVWCLVVITKKDGRYLGLGWMIVGLVMYIWFRRSYRLSTVGSLQIDKVEFKDQDVTGFTPKKVLVLLRGVGYDQEDCTTMNLACELCKEHDATLSIMLVEKVPFMMSFLVHNRASEKRATEALQRSQALALECGINSELLLIRARSSMAAITEVQKRAVFDLLILPVDEYGPSKTQLQILGDIMHQSRGMVLVVKPPVNTK